jgi:hypothetical protein
MWRISWPDWVGKIPEYLYCDCASTSQVLQTFSKGSTKSLRLEHYRETIALQDILDVLHNFLSLEKLEVIIESISSRELTSVLQGVPSDDHLPLEYLRVSGYADGTSENNPTQPSHTVYHENLADVQHYTTLWLT